jgi:hypothetical protein
LYVNIDAITLAPGQGKAPNRPSSIEEERGHVEGVDEAGILKALKDLEWEVSEIISEKVSLEQGDQMSLRKKRPKCSPIHFCQN